MGFDAQSKAVFAAAEVADQAVAAASGAWEAYKNDPSSSQQDSQRTKWLKDVEMSASRLQEAFGESAEGVAFFDRFLDYLRTLKQQVADFCFARSEEKGDHLGRLTRQMAGMNTGSGGGSGAPYQ
eukprot:GDKH01003084.1.p2 GENE.GDKH01003084.1~~GDKH01003084.1.p2  ORF type:complete len:125 (-),score=34.19 GDKH01003084.1:329-703(-)